MKIKLKALLILSSAILGYYSSSAQGVMISTDVRDVNLAGLNHSEIPGSPFLYESWEKGSVKLSNGQAYDGLLLKYDQMHDEIMFLNTDVDKIQVFAQPVHEFTIRKLVEGGLYLEKKYRNGYPINAKGSEAFYEVLVDGKTQLLKRTSKAVVEERGDNTILKTKRIKETIKYYILGPGSILQNIKLSEKIILSALNNSDIAKSFIKDNHLNLNKEADLIMLIKHYNLQNDR